jgi:hypothetical protein
MKSIQLIAAAAALASTFAFAQTPAGAMRTAQEADAANSGGPAAATAEARKNARTMGSGAAMEHKTLGANGNAMASPDEWTKTHMMRTGRASTPEMQAQWMKNGDGPN